MVVTGVNMKTGMVSMRRHASVTGGQVTVPLSQLSDAKPFKFDAQAEASEVGEAMTAQAEAKLNSLEKWADVKAMPSAVLEKNHDLIQRQIKDAKASYKGFHDLGDAYMVNKQTGEIYKAPSYEQTKLHASHDYLLPTASAKEKAIQAWIDHRRQATLSTKSDAKRSGRGSRSGAYITSAAREYKGAGYTERHVNPMRSLLRELSAETSYGTASKLEKEAQARLETEQLQRIRRAPSAMDSLKELAPLAKITGSAEGYGERDFKATYPRNALALAWARARHMGQLDDPVADTGHSGYAWAGGQGKSVHSALIRMAQASGYNDLADAFAATGERHKLSKRDADLLEALANGQSHHLPSMRTLEHIKTVAERMGIMDQTIGQLSTQKLKLGTNFTPTNTYYSYGNNNHGKKFRDQLDAMIGDRRDADARVATKEAA